MSMHERIATRMLTYKDVWPLKSTTEPSLRVPFSSTVPNNRGNVRTMFWMLGMEGELTATRFRTWGVIERVRITMRRAIDNAVEAWSKPTLALCPIILCIFQAIARFFLFNVRHCLKDTEGEGYQEGKREAGEGEGERRDKLYNEDAFKVRCMVQVGSLVWHKA